MSQYVRASHAPVFAIALTAAISTSAAAQQISHTYAGACDGSAGIALDANHFAVADDERNVLRVYKSGSNAAPWSLPLDAFLNAPKKKSGEFKEADIEGAAKVGDDLIYWIGSHARDSGGDAEPARTRLFATRVVTHKDGPRLKTVDMAYEGLREAMLKEPKLAHLKLGEAYRPDKKKNGPPPESENGFNIEGLAATRDGGLLVGLRNPRPDKQAIVIPIENPADLMKNSKPPKFGEPTLLDLEGRGIRSIEYIAGKNAGADRYLIVAGPHQDVSESDIKPPFALFTWSGKPKDTKVNPVKDVTIPGGLAPESLFVSLDGSMLTLLSDDGTDSCKKAADAKKTFRAWTVPMPK
jgi:hypothetical protein